MRLAASSFLPGLRLLLACACVVTFNAWAAPPDISGAWRLDDQHSDGADALTAMLRAEARREQPAPLPATAATAAQPGNTGATGRTGRHGDGTGGGGMAGHHGGRHGSRNKAAKPADTDQDPLAHAQFALPPLLQTDSVLLVQQQAGSVQIQLDNGERLDVRLDGQSRQSLNGDAMVQGQASAKGVRITIRFTNGRLLQQDWIRSADGHELTIQNLWKLPTLQKPVQFRRSYFAVG
ncbi:MAG TPA: hypothetical protein VFE77_10415 [Rhodanobacter sp.]|nr:hypothetical protein [Rhodanobacter sp.]